MAGTHRSTNRMKPKAKRTRHRAHRRHSPTSSWLGAGALDEANSIARRAAVQAYDNGTFETAIAKSLGMNRTTVRRWLAKR